VIYEITGRGYESKIYFSRYLAEKPKKGKDVPAGR
jgi:hypothetical protein